MNKAKTAKFDEFYTQISDIDKEVSNYNLNGKTVYCNCDNPDWSNFYIYMKKNFHRLGLSRLLSTFYTDGEAFGTIYDGESEKRFPIRGNGDFRSPDAVALLKEADVVITNPPFSLFRDFIKLMVANRKKFLVLGTVNGFKYAEVLPFVIENKMWGGMNSGKMLFRVPDHTPAREDIKIINRIKYIQLNNIQWFTNMDNANRHKYIPLTKTYNPIAYPKYDTYNAIEVSKYKEIPKDYEGVMGVPVTFLSYYNPRQFKILGTLSAGGIYNRGKAVLDGRELYSRILIKRA